MRPRGRLNVPGELWHQARKRGSHHNVPIAATVPPPRGSHHRISPTTIMVIPPTGMASPPWQHPHHHGVFPTTMVLSPPPPWHHPQCHGGIPTTRGSSSPPWGHPQHHGVIPTTTMVSFPMPQRPPHLPGILPTTAPTCYDRGLLGLVVSWCVRGHMHARGGRMWRRAPQPTWGTARPLWGAEPGGVTSTMWHQPPPPGLTRSPPKPSLTVPGLLLPWAHGKPSPMGQGHHEDGPVRRVPTRWEVVAPESCPGSWGALTVRVHPHGRGRDIGCDVEVGQPEILRGRDGAMGRLVTGCATAGWGGGVRG